MLPLFQQPVEHDLHITKVIQMILGCPELVQQIGPPDKYASKTMLDLINSLHQLYERMTKKFAENAAEMKRKENQLMEDYAGLPALKEEVKCKLS